MKLLAVGAFTDIHHFCAFNDYGDTSLIFFIFLIGTTNDAESGIKHALQKPLFCSLQLLPVLLAEP